MTLVFILLGIVAVCLPIIIWELKNAIEVPQDQDIYEL